MELKITKQLPEKHEPYTDKYFLRTNDILKQADINPRVSMKVFTRGQGKIEGLEDAVEVLKKYSDLAEQDGEVWIADTDTYESYQPLMVIKGPVQSFAELETMYLGVLSHAISEANGIELPKTEDITEKFSELKEIYGDIPITYFGARHYHWSLDKQIAKAALKGGAVQTSSDIGSSNIGKKGVGTTPHLLTIVLASIYGKEDATLKTAEYFDRYMSNEIPRVTLIDTFNRELTDSIAVAEYFDGKECLFRVDTCGENVGESGTPYHANQGKDPSYQIGTGVTVELVKNLRTRLIEEGHGDNTGIFLSSGFGNVEKARTFVAAHEEFKQETGYDLFQGVGIGEVAKARFCTADLFEVDDKPLAKVGREVYDIDYSKMKKVNLGGQNETN